MIIVPVKDGENIERALKKFKRKFEKTGVVKELRTQAPQDGARCLCAEVASGRGGLKKDAKKFGGLNKIA